MNPLQRQLNRIALRRLAEIARKKKLKPLKQGAALPAEVVRSNQPETYTP